MGSFGSNCLDNDDALDFKARARSVGTKRAGEEALKSWREFRAREEAGLAPRIANAAERAELVEMYRNGLMHPANQLQPDFVAREILEFSEDINSDDVQFDSGNAEALTLVAALAILSEKLRGDVALVQLLTEILNEGEYLFLNKRLTGDLGKPFVRRAQKLFAEVSKLLLII